MGIPMKIKFSSTERQVKALDGKKHILIGKFWLSPGGKWYHADGRIGTKSRGSDTFDFHWVALQPGDHLYLSVNKWKSSPKDPDLFLSVEKTGAE